MNINLKLIIFLTLLLFLYNFSKFKIENFRTEMCPHCNNGGWWDKGFCMRCLNCGWSVDFNGHGECKPGARSGPIINYGTKDWYYRNEKQWTALHPSDYQRKPIVGQNQNNQNSIPLNISSDGLGLRKLGRPFGHGWDPIYQHQRY